MAPNAITGLVLAGGQGQRMGGLDKGLQAWRGEPLALHALRRLRAQVSCCAISANRHLPVYAGFGVPVWPDTLPDFPGPLAGWLSGMTHAGTPWLLSVPCDVPAFPADLAGRLRAAVVEAGADLAYVRTAQRAHPVFCLLRCTLAPALQVFLEAGQRKVLAWLQAQRHAVATFDDEAAFANFNTLADLNDRH